MVVRVTVGDAEAAAGLMQRIVREVDVEDVNFDAARQQVLIEVRKSPDETIVGILNLVENWLGSGDRAPTNVEIDDHQYVLGAAR